MSKFAVVIANGGGFLPQSRAETCEEAETILRKNFNKYVKQGYEGLEIWQKIAKAETKPSDVEIVKL